MSHPLSDVMGVSMDKIRAMADANTVVGTPINTPNGVTIIPVSKISFGFGSGGTDLPAKSGGAPFGGGAGGGVTIQPVSFLIVKGESVRMLPVAEPASGSLERVIEQLPDLLDRLDDYRAKRKAEKDAVKEAVAEAAEDGADE